MKVKELILQLLEFPQDAEVVCSSIGGYLAPYKVDNVKHFSAVKLAGVVPQIHEGSDIWRDVEDAVYIGTAAEEKAIARKHFKFTEFFKPGHLRKLF